MSCFAAILREATVSRFRQTCLMSVVFAVLCLMVNVRRLSQMRCSYSDTLLVVQDLCSKYSSRRVSGPMCRQICEKNVFKFEFCGQDVSSEKSVLIMGCNNCGLGEDVSKVVMKVNYNSTKLDYITHALFKASDDIGETVSRTKEFLGRQVVRFIGENLPWDVDTLSQLLGSDFNTWASHRPPQDIRTMLRTLVALSLQPEYVKLSFLGPIPFLPKLYGFCGPAFFVENTPSLTQVGYIVHFKAMPSEIALWNFKFASWSQRAQAALDLLSTLRALETSSGPTLHICDLEIRNTGINSKDGVVFLDIDKARYDMEFSGRNCSTDYNCDMETCKGRCDLKKKVCAPERVNNNIQVACQKLLLGNFRGLTGLLRFPPMSIGADLRRLLDECSNPSNYSGSTMSRPQAASVEILDKLGLLLLRSLEET